MIFYRTNHGAEIDLILSYANNKKIGIEIKLSASPSLSRGNHEVLNNLNLDKLFVVIPTNDNYFLKKNIEVIGLKAWLNHLKEKN